MQYDPSLSRRVELTVEGSQYDRNGAHLRVPTSIEAEDLRGSSADSRRPHYWMLPETIPTTILFSTIGHYHGVTQPTVGHSETTVVRGNLGTLIHVLLAGDAGYAPFLLEGRNKSYLRFPGGILLDYTLQALSESRSLSALVVVGPNRLRHLIPSTIDQRPVRFLLQGAGFTENVRNALEMLDERWPGARAVFLTNDAPFLSGREIDDFYSITNSSGADIVVGLARISDADLATSLGKQYRRSAVPLSDGLYLLANQVSCSPRVASILPTVESVFTLRRQSSPGTVIKTIRYALADTRRAGLLFSWTGAVMAKTLWRITGVNCSRLSVSDLERDLESVIQRSLTVHLRVVPDAQGCWDADTETQLSELRSFARLCPGVGIKEAINV